MSLLIDADAVDVGVVAHSDFDVLLERIATALQHKGYIILDDVLPSHLAQGLLRELDDQMDGGLRPAGVGRGGDYQQNQRIRRDKICWLQGRTVAAAEFLAWMDNLRQGVNRRLFLGLFDYEAHFALYEPGDFYQKHRDAFRDDKAGYDTGGYDKGKGPGRKLSTVLYLNPDWSAADAGELVLYDEAGENVLEVVAPLMGRLLVFLSEDFPHEVLPAQRERKSIAGWFRVNRL